MPLKILGDDKSHGAASFRLGDLPPELAIKIAEEISAEIGESGSVAAALDFRNFRSASRFTHALTSITPGPKQADRVFKRLGRVRSLAERVYDAAAPGEDFSKNQSEDLVLETIDRLGAVLPMQSNERKAAFSKIVSGIQNESVRNKAIANSVQVFNSLDAKDRSPLIHESIRMFINTVPSDRDHSTAREAIAKAYGFMEADHHTALKAGLIKRFDREELGLALSRDLRRVHSEMPVANGAGHTEFPSDKEISGAAATLQGALRRTDAHSSERMNALESAADFVAPHAKSARQALMRSERTRSHSGLEA